MNLLTEKPRFSIKNLFRKKEKLSSAAPSPAPKKNPKKKKIITIVIILAVIVIAFVVLHFVSASKASKTSSVTYSSANAKTMDISQTLSSTGTLKPANSYTVTSLVTGKILSADFNEGDTVTSGQKLYAIDTTDAQTSIESARLNVQKAQLSYNQAKSSLDNLSVLAPVSGTITQLSVNVGDQVNAGASIGTIKNSSTMSLTVPFNSADVDSFFIGESAEVTLESTFETLYGTITKINGSQEVETGNMLVRKVTIDVSNPGGITDSTVATAKVGDVACNGSATFSYKSSQTISAKTSGTVSSVVHGQGDNVSKGEAIIRLDSDNLAQTLANAELSLEDAQNTLSDRENALDNYTITSPIDGTVINKNYKAGDKIGSGSSSSSSGSSSSSSSSSSGSSSSSSSSSSGGLCTIYDLSYLTMDMDVDELDISEVQVGQDVSITADAVSGKTFKGIVTKVNINGTTSNGVTAYPVTVKITDTDGLLPGMNVNAEIVVKSVSNVIGIPVDAVVRGNKVLVQKDSSKTVTNADGTLQSGSSNVPDGFEYADVTLGISNNNYIEVKSGLSDGDVIAVKKASEDTSTSSKSTSSTKSTTRSEGGGDMGGGPGGGGGGPMGG